MSRSYVRSIRSICTRTNTGATTIACTPLTPMLSMRCSQRERGALLIHKARIGSQFGHGSAGFDPAKDVLLRQVLVFNRDGWLTVNAGTAEMLQGDSRETQSLPGQKLSVIHFMTLSCRPFFMFSRPS